MWKWLKRVFGMNDKKEKKVDAESIREKASKEPLPPSLIDERKKLPLRKFEIEVFDENLNDDGTISLKPVKSERAIILEVATPNELQAALNQYRLCGQVAKIVRAIDPPPPSPGQVEQLASSSSVQPVSPVVQQFYPASPQAPSQAASVTAVVQKPKPKIITIGDMQVKYDGDKVYQKQWVKLNSAEAGNFRVVNDSSNKIVPLTGKHIEAKRWVLVEETAEDNIDDAVEAILAGN